jgi:hypothetical protein
MRPLIDTILNAFPSAVAPALALVILSSYSGEFQLKVLIERLLAGSFLPAGIVGFSKI